MWVAFHVSSWVRRFGIIPVGSLSLWLCGWGKAWVLPLLGQKGSSQKAWTNGTNNSWASQTEINPALFVLYAVSFSYNLAKVFLFAKPTHKNEQLCTRAESVGKGCCQITSCFPQAFQHDREAESPCLPLGPLDIFSSISFLCSSRSFLFQSIPTPPPSLHVPLLSASIRCDSLARLPPSTSKRVGITNPLCGPVRSPLQGTGRRYLVVLGPFFFSRRFLGLVSQKGSFPFPHPFREPKKKNQCIITTRGEGEGEDRPPSFLPVCCTDINVYTIWWWWNLNSEMRIYIYLDRSMDRSTRLFYPLRSLLRQILSAAWDIYIHIYIHIFF